jgi:hypothetical protein
MCWRFKITNYSPLFVEVDNNGCVQEISTYLHWFIIIPLDKLDSGCWSSPQSLRDLSNLFNVCTTNKSISRWNHIYVASHIRRALQEQTLCYTKLLYVCLLGCRPTTDKLNYFCQSYKYHGGVMSYCHKSSRSYFAFGRWLQIRVTRVAHDFTRRLDWFPGHTRESFATAGSKIAVNLQ